MKKALALLIAIIAAVAAVAYHLGHNAGKMYAITQSCIWTVDCYDPYDPDDSAWNGYDQLIYIELDGDVWEHGMYQG